MSSLLTYSSLAAEAALAFGLWLPRLRYVVMAAGIGLHLGIKASLLIGWFSPAVVSSYLAFVPAEQLRRNVETVIAKLTIRAAVGAQGSAPDPALRLSS
ncbi:MAG: hypothetical protein NVSMB55_11170 [Mycobacteriales bacterium]